MTDKTIRANRAFAVVNGNVIRRDEDGFFIWATEKELHEAYQIDRRSGERVVRVKITLELE